MRYDDFLAYLDSGPTGELRIRVLDSPAGQATAELALGDDFLALGSSLHGDDSASGASRSVRNLAAADGLENVERLAPREIGTLLWDHLFAGSVRRLFDQSLGGLGATPDRGLRIRIKVDPREPRAAQLSALPWELLFRPETEDFLALSRKTPVVRYLDVPRPCQPITVEGPLRVLAAMSSPRDLPALDLAAERRKLDLLGQQQENLQLTFLEHASTAEVRGALIDGGFHVLHFMGHGDLDPKTGEGLLYFEGDDGSAEPASGRAVATKLKDLAALGLVVLNACNTAQSAVRRGASPFSGVAGALVLGGVPAVLAMQRPIPDRAAIRFSQALYRRLAAGDPVDGALTEARQAIHSVSPDALEWAIPVLFTRVSDGNVFRMRAPPAADAPAPPPALATPAEQPAARKGHGKTIAGGMAAAVLVTLGAAVLMKGLPSRPDSSGAGKRTEPSVEPSPEPGEKESKKLASPSKPGPSPVDPPVRSAPPAQTVVGSSPSHEPNPAPPPEPPSTDPDDLLCQCSSFYRREGKGMRAEMSCTNSGSRRVELTLDAMLTDELSSAYSIVDSDLPTAARGFRLAVDAGTSTRFSLDFPAPKLGASEFSLELLTAAGPTIPLRDPALSLRGP